MDQYGVIGSPIKHSKSPFIFQQFAKQTRENISYIPILCPIDQFAITIKELQKKGIKGLNVTLPFKEQAFNIANEQSELAKQAQAANTLLFNEQGDIYADNTDGPGFIKDLCSNHHFSLSHKKILLLGAGGAARNIIGSLLKAQPQKLIIANRDINKAIYLTKHFSSLFPEQEIFASDLINIPNESHDLIINSTSAGLTGDQLILPDYLISPHSWCYDLMYGETTPFLKWASLKNPAQCIDGLGMLVEQAARSYSIWRGGILPETKAVISALRNEILKKVQTQVGEGR